MISGSDIKKSLSLPGVATMISLCPFIQSLICNLFLWTPTNSLTSKSLWWCVNLSASLAICVANSCVGLMMSAPTCSWVETRRVCPSKCLSETKPASIMACLPTASIAWRWASIAGIRKARGLPVPVWALMSKSLGGRVKTRVLCLVPRWRIRWYVGIYQSRDKTRS